ncbi:MAG: citrate lyase acyl carrier protein [Thermoplasmata archaeon]
MCDSKIEGIGFTMQENKIVRTASAGTVESSDAMVTVSPNEGGGIAVEIQSPVKAQYEDDMIASVKEVCASLKIKDAKVSINDKGALDYALRARIEAALIRATKQ